MSQFLSRDKFKIGDRVICTNFIEFPLSDYLFKRGVVVELTKGAKFNVVVKFDGTKSNQNMNHLEIQLDQVFYSPLYSELK